MHSFLDPLGKGGNTKGGNEIGSCTKGGNGGNGSSICFSFSGWPAAGGKFWVFWSVLLLSLLFFDHFKCCLGKSHQASSDKRREYEGREWDSVWREGREFPPFPPLKGGNRKLWTLADSAFNKSLDDVYKESDNIRNQTVNLTQQNWRAGYWLFSRSRNSVILN